MLPAPVSFVERRIFRRDVPISRSKKVLELLLTRTRVTNLAVLLLASITIISLLSNLSYYFSVVPHLQVDSPNGILATISRGKTIRGLDHLIIVPGHAIWKGIDPGERLQEDQWILEPYQRGGGRISAFLAHISRGADLAREDHRSLIVFSGGQTRQSSTTSEGESYLRLALSTNAFQTSTRFMRATSEDYALDSYQNLLFSMARFHEFTGKYPAKITVVGYEFKQSRFRDLHRAALRWPSDRFNYVGIDPESDHNISAQEGERQNGYLPYSQDPYGCHAVLLAKRKQRNPYTRFHPYYTSSPQLSALFDWCPGGTGGENIFKGKLPWDHF